MKGSDSDLSDISFEIEEEEFNAIYRRELQKKHKNANNPNSLPKQQPVLPVDYPSQKPERERSRSREKKSPHISLLFEPQKIIRHLPIFKKKQEILNTIMRNQISLITGETGCGKSTQVPRLIYEYLRQTQSQQKIICVQPRRLAVKNLFKILSRQIPKQNIVGYQIAMESYMKQETKILFMTNGIFLQRLIHSTKIFEQYPFIILDEVHERDIDTDFLLLAMKRIARRFPKLRIVLMSATIDNKLFRYYFAEDEVDNFLKKKNFYKKWMEEMDKYHKSIEERERDDEFEGNISIPDEEDKIYRQLQMQFLKAKYPCPAINVTDPGRYTKQYFYLDNFTKFTGSEISMKWGTVCFSHKYPCAHRELNEVVNIILDRIEKTSGRDRSYESVLIFMPGLAEIETLASDITGFFGRKSQNFLIIKCHSSLLNEETTQKLHTLYRQKIKVIIATNIAESSITVLGVKYVIDLCLSKEINFDQKSRMENLQLVWSSKASCKQRAGRTGRVCDGIVFRLVEQDFFRQFPDYSTPEIQRSSLDKLILRIKLIHENESEEEQKLFQDPGDVLGTAIQPPILKHIDESIKSLKSSGGLRWVNEELVMTSLGRIYVDVPLDIIYSKMILFSLLMGTFEDIIILVCMLSQNKNAFRKLFVERYFLDYYEMMVSPERCDFLALVNVYKAKLERRSNSKIQLDIFYETKQMVEDIKKRFKQKKLFPFEHPSNDDYYERFKVTIMYGFLNNLLRVSSMTYDDKQEKRVNLMKKMRVPLHNTVVLLNSDIIRKSPENNEEADAKLKNIWLEHICRTMRIPRPNVNLTLGFGISYLHFTNEEDLNKFLFVKNMQKNKKIIEDYNNRSNHLTLNQILPHLGDIDYMQEGCITEYYKSQKIFVDNFSTNRVVAASNESNIDFPATRLIVTNTIIQQSNRLNCRYSSLLPDIPHIDVIMHLIFYPFVELLPDRKLTRYEKLHLFKKSKIKIQYELTDNEIQEANQIRLIIKQLFKLELIIPREQEMSEEESSEKQKINWGEVESKKNKISSFWKMVKAFVSRQRKSVIGEEKWQQVYFEEKKIKRSSEVEVPTKEEVKQYMNQIRCLKLNYSYFSDLYPSEIGREGRYKQYIEWKEDKIREVRILEDKALNNDAYLICAVDNCNMKIVKMQKIGNIVNTYYRDIFQSSNLTLLENEQIFDDQFRNTLMSLSLQQQYEVYGCKNHHAIALKFQGEKKMKIAAFSQVNILYPDETIEERPDFNELEWKHWKKNNDNAIAKKNLIKEENYCFICNQKTKTMKELELHVKNGVHVSNVKDFLETMPKQEKMVNEDDYPY